MRIAITSDIYYPMTNGVAVFAHNLALNLAKKGHRVMVICPSFKGKKHITQQKNLRTVYLTSMRLPFYPDQIEPVPEKKIIYRHGIWFAVNAGHQVKKALDWFKPDVIHVQTNEPIAIASKHYALSKNIPLVTTGHTFPDQITGQFELLKPIKKPLDAIVKKYLVSFMKNSEYTTMPTELAIQELTPEPSKRFKVQVEAISNGVDLSNFKPGRAKEYIYKKYKIPKTKKIAIHVGRIDADKSVDRVIDAFERVLRKRDDAVLLIVGDGIAKADLIEMTQALGISKNVRFLGRVLPPDLNEIYKTADVFVTASEIETQGVVLVEAAATGLPLVAVDAGAVADLVRDGENGFLCKAGGDIKGIAEGLEKILSDDVLAKRMSAESLVTAKQHDLSITVKRFLEIYEEAIRIKGIKDDGEKKRRGFFFLKSK
ncbi:glycosyltransferase [Candidatus Saccharibacteria bacterium]|nr:glycosyltransferase [Candidatus Saccharibacteria bacterium]MBQ6147272.1 glycosyltransferase [Candidatus Saccharibacteria bacterium]